MKKFLSVFLSLILSVTSMAVLAPSIAHAVAPYTCTWTGATNNNFSNAGNWSGCNSAAPQAGDGDNLVFNEPTTTTTLVNDITGLTVGSITFQGSNSGHFIFGSSGQAFSISGGINDTSANATNIINVPVTLTSSQTFASIGITFGSTVTLGNNALTINGGNVGINGLSGSGAITLNETHPGAALAITGTSSNYSGTINVGSGATLSVSIDAGNIGTGSVIVQSGGQLELNSAAATGSFPNNITIAGAGVGNYGAITSCLASTIVCTDSQDTTLTLSGSLTLTGDTQLANGAYFPGEPSAPANSATFKLTGSFIPNGHTLTAIANSNTILTGFTTAPITTTTSSSTKTPKTPNTGFALVKDQPILMLVGTVLVAGALFILARNNRKPARR